MEHFPLFKQPWKRKYAKLDIQSAETERGKYEFANAEKNAKKAVRMSSNKVTGIESILSVLDVTF